MSWPTSEMVNAALRSPTTSLLDPELGLGHVTTTPSGIPLPRSGNFADVYQVTSQSGRVWAVKCFHKPVSPDLGRRYAAISEELNRANLPFTVPFEFQAAGLRVGNAMLPIVKMQWVEGQPLNSFVKANLNNASNLEGMLSLWVRLCRRLRETGMAHCDIQHGNAMLVPGERGKALGLKLVDYDGFFVPALAGQPTGEPGHPSYQHPQRNNGSYSADLDRFPHLIVATALRGLLVGGQPLWNEFDTGDNLIFTANDFTTPSKSRAMRKLWELEDPFTTGLFAHLVIACSKPLAATPWLDSLMPDGHAPILTPSQERRAMELLGFAETVAVPALPMPAPLPVAVPVEAPAVDLGFADEEESSYTRRRQEKPVSAANKFLVPIIFLLASGGAIAGAYVYLKNKAETKEVASATEPEAPYDPPPKVVVKPKKPASSSSVAIETAKGEIVPVDPSPMPSPMPMVTPQPMEPMVVPIPETPMVPVKPKVVEAPAVEATPGRKHPDAGFAASLVALEKTIAENAFKPAVEMLQKLVQSYYLPREVAKQYRLLGPLVKTTDDQRTLALLALELADNYLENFDSIRAREVLDDAISRGGKELTNLRRNRELIPPENAAWAMATDAWNQLREEPQAPDAILKVARYRCFVQGMWFEGLAMVRALPDGVDAPLRKVARMEADAEPHAVAAAWEQWAETQPEPAKSAGLRRARMWHARQMQFKRGPIAAQKRADELSRIGRGTALESVPGLIQVLKTKDETTTTFNWDTTGLKLMVGGLKDDQLLETVWKGRLVPPSSGRYQVLLDGDISECSLSFGLDTAKPAQMQVVSEFNRARILKGSSTATLVLAAEDAIPFEITFRMPATDKTRVSLKWIRPGSVLPELIPLEYIYHKPGG